MDIEVIKQQFIEVRKKIKYSALEGIRLDQNLVTPLKQIRFELVEKLNEQPEDIELLRMLYHINCYFLSYKKAEQILSQIVILTKANKDKKELYLLRELLIKNKDCKLTSSQMENLVNYVAICLEKNGCDHSLKHTKEWLDSNVGRSKHKKIIIFIQNSGGYCDCEVVANILSSC